MTDAVTRLQRERDLALRRVDELHDYYKKEIQKKDDADHKATLIGMEQRTSQVREAQKETEHYKKQFENAMSLVETQKLSIKLLQDELGEEAEFESTTMKIEWLSYSPTCRRRSINKSTC